MARLRAADTEDFYADDPEWLKLLDHELRGELDEVKKELADALRGSRVRVFHGCRTDDAGVYFREGLKVHRWDELIAQVRVLVDADEHRRDRKSVIEQTIAELGKYRNLDEGHSYVVLDERPLIEDSAHYLIYGSELISAAFRQAGQGFLRERGTPTMLLIDLPLSIADLHERCELARDMLQEWTRQIAWGCDEVAKVDFTFTLKADLPREHIVGHYHPRELRVHPGSFAGLT